MLSASKARILTKPSGDQAFADPEGRPRTIYPSAIRWRILKKCRSTFTVMFISITDLNIPDNDNSTYFSVSIIDAMQEPGETLKFDKNNIDDFGRWIQARDHRTRKRLITSELSLEISIFLIHSYHDQQQFLNFQPQIRQYHFMLVLNADI